MGIKIERYDGLKLVGIIDPDFNNKETCKHKVERIDVITGDPNIIKVMCVKCGEKAEHNIITGETR